MSDVASRLIFPQHPAARGFDLSHVKFILCGAAPLSAELVRQLIVLFPECRIGQGYGQSIDSLHDTASDLIKLIGMTETCASVSMVPPTQKIGTIGSAGQLIPGVYTIKQFDSLLILNYC